MREKGYINEGPTFGEGTGLLNLNNQMGCREGFGAELTDGSFRIEVRYGHPQLSISENMQDIPEYDPRDLTAAIDAPGLCLFTSFALNADDYAERGWDSEGVPTPEKLRELGLGEPVILHAHT